MVVYSCERPIREDCNRTRLVTASLVQVVRTYPSCFYTKDSNYKLTSMWLNIDVRWADPRGQVDRVDHSWPKLSWVESSLDRSSWAQIAMDRLFCLTRSILGSMLVGRQEGHPACTNCVMGCSWLSGARCRFAYGPADATATHCLLLH